MDRTRHAARQRRQHPVTIRSADDPDLLDATSTRQASHPAESAPAGAEKARRLITCHYLGRHRNQCTAEAVDPDGEILLCISHLGRALELAGHLPGVTITLTPPE